MRGQRKVREVAFELSFRMTRLSLEREDRLEGVVLGFRKSWSIIQKCTGGYNHNIVNSDN